MRIAIEKSILENILTNLQPFLEKKDASQITSHILLDAREGSLDLKATDFEIGLEAITPSCNILEEGTSTVNGRKVLDIIKRLGNGEILLKQEGDNLLISQNRSNFKLPIFDPAEFPEFPSLQEQSKIEIQSTELIKSIKKIVPAIDTNNPKYELNGALIDIKEYSINFVATDTRRLAVVKYENPSVNRLSIIIPKKAIIEIQKLFFSDIEIYYDETNMIIKSEHYLFFTKLIGGKFPDYERIIPNETRFNTTLPKGKIIEQIKIINSISNDVKITFKNGSIMFESISDENQEAVSEMEYETGFSEEVTIAINSRYLLDFLSGLESEEFEIGINESNLPFRLKKDNFTTVVMPIIL